MSSEALRLAQTLDNHQAVEEDAADMLRSLLGLLADIREACGDKGERMQPELVEHIRQGFAERDQLRAEVERLRPNARRYEWLRDAHPADESAWVAVGTPYAPGGVSCWRHDDLDMLIDRAIEAAKEA